MLLVSSSERMHQTALQPPNSLRLTIRRRQRKRKGKGRRKSSMEPTHLPPELWLMILDYLPPSFFQENLGRLTLSKRWYDLAFPIFLRRLEYTPKVISRIVDRRRATSPSHSKAAALLKARDNVLKSRCVTVVIDGNPDNTCFNTPDNLLRFGDLLRKSKHLKTLRLISRPANERWKADPCSENDPLIGSLFPLTDRLTFLTELDIDLFGGSRVPKASSDHLCTKIRPLLLRLRRLSIRSRCLCKEAFRLFPGEKVSLQHLTVDLDLGTISKVNPKLNTTSLCDPDRAAFPRAWRWQNPIDELRRALKVLAKRMCHPEQVQIIHKALNGEIHLWDVASDSCVLKGVEKGLMNPFWPTLELEAGRCTAEDQWRQL
ncbi:hypothetical protein B0T16DRAFT_453695 [Cercophora newfieldiana]|uniref:F-box domain-containing protein n=1 Tax=Cercophora newfieldiana TaxID=92897 RepID=A0AA39YEJ4_9PEZI|nr:hypothetical protein B0T16DRAFT_453695 [Cercophora newfieldiana]